jgi:hypothetical protein
MFKFISDLFLKVFRTLKPIFAAVFNTAFQILLEKLKDIATNSITTLAATDLTSEAKRQQAFDDIKKYAVSKMLTVSSSDINLIIEVIYKQLKNQGVIK